MEHTRNRWTEADFDNLSWHDCTIYSIHFPNKDLELFLDIDFIIEWVLAENNQYKFWVAPGMLVFKNVLYLKLNIDFENSNYITIDHIIRENERLSPNGKLTMWDFTIVTDKGKISFESTGFHQQIIAELQFGFNQVSSFDRSKSFFPNQL